MNRKRMYVQSITTILHPFNGLFSGTTWISRYQKGKTRLDLNEARDDGIWGCSGISWTICKQSARRSRQITTPTPHHSFFYRPDALPGVQVSATDSVKALTALNVFSGTCCGWFWSPRQWWGSALARSSSHSKSSPKPPCQHSSLLAPLVFTGLSMGWVDPWVGSVSYTHLTLPTKRIV